MLPGAVCAVAALLGWVVGRRSTRGRDAVLAVGVAAAFAASMFALEMGPDFPLRPSEDAWLWIVWIAVAGAIVGVIETFARVPAVARMVLRAAVGFGVLWVLTRPLHPFDAGPNRSSVLYPLLGATVAVPGLWSVLADPRPRASRVALVGPLLVALPVAAGILALYGHSLRMGMATGALGVAVGATAVFGWRRAGSRPVPTPAAAVVVLVFVGILLSAVAYLNFGDTVAFPLPVPILLLASAACCIARSWKVALILAVLLAGGAAVVAGVHDAKNGPVTEGW